MFARSPNWPPISFARSDEWRCFGHARKLNRGHKSRSRLDITTKSWPCSCKQSPINIILVQSCISLLWDVRVGRWRCHQLSLLPPFQSHPFSFLSSENYARWCCQWFDPELKLFFCSPKTKADICLGLWKVVAEYIDDMSNDKNGINDDFNGDEDDDYADVCLEHRSQGGGGALMSSCPKLRRTFAQTCLRPANLQKLRANNQTIPLPRPANQENLGKFYFWFPLQIMPLLSTKIPTCAIII